MHFLRRDIIGSLNAAWHRRVALPLACLAVFGWALLAATHFHDHAEPRHEGVAACIVCLAMPAGAPAPASLSAVAFVAAAGAAIVLRVAPAPLPVLPSSYLSRGPPAV